MGHCLLCCKVCFLALAWPPSLQNVEESLRHVDATFFLGKVGFLVTGGKCAPRPPRAVCRAPSLLRRLADGRNGPRNLTCRRSF